eukprot:c24171_g1_i1 orf=945-1433(-)
MKDADLSKDAGILSCNAVGRSRYKIWVLVVIVLLALWSLLSGSARIARNWSAGYAFSYSSPSKEQKVNVDVLEMDTREKIVSQMWEKYQRNPRLKLSSFWQDAFEAGYEELESEIPTIRQMAIAEIARLSAYAFDLVPQTYKLPQSFDRSLHSHQNLRHRKS